MQSFHHKNLFSKQYFGLLLVQITVKRKYLITCFESVRQLALLWKPGVFNINLKFFKLASKPDRRPHCAPTPASHTPPASHSDPEPELLAQTVFFLPLRLGNRSVWLLNVKSAASRNPGRVHGRDPCGLAVCISGGSCGDGRSLVNWVKYQCSYNSANNHLLKSCCHVTWV